MAANWPDWWFWELELSTHILERMVDRDFNELDLRLMLETATDYRRDTETGCWAIQTKFRHHPWEVIVKPQEDIQTLLVVTAYPMY